MRELAVPGLHLTVLWSLAVTQPLLDLLGDAPEFFVARANTRVDIIVLAVGLTLLPPLLLILVEAVASAVSWTLRGVLHLVIVAVLVAAFTIQVLKDGPGGSSGVLILMSIGVGLVAARLYARTRIAPMLLTALAPAPLVFLVIFLLISPVSKLVLPGEEVKALTVAIRDRAPVVMILYDELSGLMLLGPDHRVNAARFPNFARLAHESTWYRNANTVADYTENAVPALLTGQRPERGAAPIAADHPNSLFTLLGGEYSLDVTEPVTDVCPERLCPSESAGREPFQSRIRGLVSDLGVVSLHLMLPDDLADDLPPVDRSFGDFERLAGASGGTSAPDPGRRARQFGVLVATAQRVQQFREFNRRLGGSPHKAHLSFLHVQLPHFPYFFLPTGQRYPETLKPIPGLDPHGAQPATWRNDGWLARQAFQRDLLQLEFSDRLLGEAMARMRASGLYDRALFVVVADHGVNFKPGLPLRIVVDGSLPQNASIPLFIKAPHQRGGRISDANVQLTDVLPTIAARLGIRVPWSTDGRPAERARHAGDVTVRQERNDEDVSIPFDEFVRRRDAAVEGMLADFGEKPRDLYRMGPDKDLLGRPVAALAAGALGARFELYAGGLFGSVDPNGPVVPSFVTGEVTRLPAGARLAVAVNGRVATVTHPFKDDDVERFSAIVPPTAFMRGANDVELMAVTGRGSGRRFELVRGAALGYRLVRTGGRQTLVDDTGRRTPVVRSAVEGHVDSLSVNGDVTIAGWAGITHPPRAADRIVAFAGDRFLTAAKPYMLRSDLVDKFGRGLRKAGFKVVSVLGEPEPGADEAPIQVFAIIGRRASALTVPKVP